MATAHQTKAEDVIGKAKDIKFQYYPSRRSVVYSTNGIVSCTQPLAAEAGVRILKQGGNAAVGYLNRYITTCNLNIV
jgi:gamma-glutamyltranspeptidase